MESNNAVSYEHLRSMDDEARRLIDEVLVPGFEKLRADYPEAMHWNVSIAAYIYDHSFFEVITFVMVDPDLSGDNPGGSDEQANPYGEAITEVLTRVDRILKEEKDTYDILVDDPLKTNRLALHCYTMFNT